MKGISSRADLAFVLAHPSITEGERTLLGWQYRTNGDFFTALWRAISHADMGNLYRLKAGFPQEVQAYIDFAHTGDFAKKVDAILSERQQPGEDAAH